MTEKITKEAILNAFSKVEEPDLHQDLVTLNMIHNLEIEADKVSFTIMLTTPACPFRAKIEREAKEAVHGSRWREVRRSSKWTQMCPMMVACADWSKCLFATQSRSVQAKAELANPLWQ